MTTSKQAAKPVATTDESKWTELLLKPLTRGADTATNVLTGIDQVAKIFVMTTVKIRKEMVITVEDVAQIKIQDDIINQL